MILKLKIILIVAVISFIGVSVYRQHSSATTVKGSIKGVAAKAPAKTVKAPAPVAQAPAPAQPVTECTGNGVAQKVIVSISRQHLWACSGGTLSYDSAVVTGMELYPADLTPTGTYYIRGEYTNQTLKGCDSTGCWNDFVSYWMPFLSNGYGTYGFHDATWRADSDFGNVNIDAPYTAAQHGSHGCVELPLATAKWLYTWANVGATVSIIS